VPRLLDTTRQLADRVLQGARKRLLTPIDTLERHLVVAKLIGAPRTVVDVGGDPGQLAGALPGTAITAVNVQPPADLLVDPGPLPFCDRSIEAVTSLDTLEHVPPADRAAFVAELLRICAERLVLCCPLWSPEHEASEREMQAWHTERTGEPHPWLAEHLEHGLPKLEDLRAWFAAATEADDRVRFAFHGDFRPLTEAFKAFAEAFGTRDLRAQARFTAARLRHVPDLELRDEPEPYVNRVFVLVERGPQGPAPAPGSAPGTAPS
jgi:hypothetical protein